MKIPFTKTHGARNDFLFTWRQEAPDPGTSDHAALARAICDRHTGIGADGWMLVDPPCDPDAEGTIQGRLCQTWRTRQFITITRRFSSRTCRCSMRRFWRR